MFGFKVAGNFALVPTGKRSKQKLSFFRSKRYYFLCSRDVTIIFLQSNFTPSTNDRLSLEKTSYVINVVLGPFAAMILSKFIWISVGGFTDKTTRSLIFQNENRFIFFNVWMEKIKCFSGWNLSCFFCHPEAVNIVKMFLDFQNDVSRNIKLKW